MSTCKRPAPPAFTVNAEAEGIAEEDEMFVIGIIAPVVFKFAGAVGTFVTGAKWLDFSSSTGDWTSSNDSPCNFWFNAANLLFKPIWLLAALLSDDAIFPKIYKVKGGKFPCTKTLYSNIRNEKGKKKLKEG